MSTDVDIWMPMYIGDMLAKTTRLTTEQIGAAYLLMMDYWKNGTIPNNNQIIASVTRLTATKAKSLKTALINSGLFEATDDEITSRYLDGLREKAEDNKTSKSERAKKAADARWENERKAKDLAEQQAMQMHNSSNANAMHKHAPSNAKSMLEQCPSTSTSSINKQQQDAQGNVPEGELQDFEQKIDGRLKNFVDLGYETLPDNYKQSALKNYPELNDQSLRDLWLGFSSNNLPKTGLIKTDANWLTAWVVWLSVGAQSKINHQVKSKSKSYKKPSDGNCNAHWEGQYVPEPIEFDQEKHKAELAKAGLI